MIQFIHTTANPYSGFTPDDVSPDDDPLNELKMADIQVQALQGLL